MRQALINFFRDETFGPKMGIYNLTHIAFLLFIFAIAFALFFAFRKKDMRIKRKVLDVILCIILILYFGDFFIHPFENNENALIVDKLPFHLCTSACILNGFFRIFREKLKNVYFIPIILGLVGAMMYITVPLGVDDCYLFCYRSLQTLIYHGLFFIFGVLSIAFGDVKLSFRTFYKIPICIAIQIAVSIFANAVYSTEDHHYDWYFSSGSTFGISEYLMPFVMLCVLTLTCAIVYGIYYLAIYFQKKKV